MWLSAVFYQARPPHPRSGIVRVMMHTGHFPCVKIVELRNAHNGRFLGAPRTKLRDGVLRVFYFFLDNGEVQIVVDFFARGPDVSC